MSSFKRKMSPLAGFPKNIYKVVTSIMEILIMTITVVANHLLTKQRQSNALKSMYQISGIKILFKYVQFALKLPICDFLILKKNEI